MLDTGTSVARAYASAHGPPPFGLLSRIIRGIMARMVRPAVFVMVLAGVVLVAACSDAEGQPQLDLSAEMTVRDRGDAVVGTPCVEEASLPLRIEDANGESLAQPRLTPGDWAESDDPPGAIACALRFTAKLPGRDKYLFRVGDSPTLAFEYDELADQRDRFTFFNPEQFFDPDSYSPPRTP